MRKKVVILGATGSIGTSTVDVLRAHPDRFELVGASCNTDIRSLRTLLRDFPFSLLAAVEARTGEEGMAFTGTDAAVALVRECRPDIVVNGISGAAGFLPSIAALSAGCVLALANKETIVMAGPLAFSIAEKTGAKILPVDSEHSAIFQLLQAHGRESVEELILTASGGPFRGWSAERLRNVTVAEALAHPTWKMGGKISIDSATLANKGLEVIEAVRMFGFPPSSVSVLVHPQSKVHSLIRLRDGSMYAQISDPDMRVPIQGALFWPECPGKSFGKLNLAGSTLSFEPPDETAFPMLPLAYQAARQGGLYPAAYNAANEIAVTAFIAARLRFTDIGSVVASVMESDWLGGDLSVESVLDGDARARAAASVAIQEYSA
ncbi:MAG: 1-deoxy-D-xylulose-5-phosphate reductoisomerase [Treponema sp. GWB1_62_6]|nr:MAG: 1-deoxy-D-xylulose-5-phosphate reductoisomerase [Treponema sp. GWB1_62_6]OHE69231.1 MAG: 1-deoxy-D-xylulose-5-phosphate reductoisomerase [Treponema sp. GWC1_61_84]OHE71071.1 MAG: 1-deoxy-D-xylulose-5-phosphate reductoisomerase [Treponema sp. RIFOXYC1_FULL_61_9]HCM27143.1 1-deoxy-D-xylulose-5-phosphate reductoisomerase [Treponema sp.]